MLEAYGESKAAKKGILEKILSAPNVVLDVMNTAVNLAGVAVAKYGTDPARQVSGQAARLRAILSSPAR